MNEYSIGLIDEEFDNLKDEVIDDVELENVKVDDLNEDFYDSEQETFDNPINENDDFVYPIEGDERDVDDENIARYKTSEILDANNDIEKSVYDTPLEGDIAKESADDFVYPIIEEEIEEKIIDIVIDEEGITEVILEDSYEDDSTINKEEKIIEDIPQLVEEKIEQPLPISPEEYDGKRIAFTSDELGKIAKEARQRKFKMSNETYLYPKNDEENIKNFISAIRFLENLALNIEISYPDISRKIHAYLKGFTERFHIATEIITELAEDINYGKDIILLEAKTFVRSNYRDITNILNECYPIGMAIKEYDPSSSVGII